MRPECEAQVVRYGFELGAPVGPDGGADVEADAAAPVPTGAGDECGEGNPGGGECEVEAASLGPRASEVSGDERAVKEEEEDRGGGHHFLGAHAEQAGGGGEAKPAAGMRGLEGAEEKVERQQIEQRHERLDALHDVGDGFGLERVERPEQGDGERENCRLVGGPEFRACAGAFGRWQFERAANDGEEG